MSIDRVREAVSRVFGDEEQKLKEFEENEKHLTPRNVTEEGHIPLVPRFFWLDARQSYIFSQYAGAVLLAGMSIEIGLRQFLEGWFERKIGNKLSSFFEELDFRKAISLTKSLYCFTDKEIHGKLHECYNIRTKYSHAKLSSILDKLGEEPITSTATQGERPETHPLKEDDFLSAAVASLNAQDDALKMIQLVEEAFQVIFSKSGYWSGVTGKP